MAASACALDLLTVGRSSVDLYGEQFGGRLEEMRSFAMSLGGSPTNTAVAAQRLGLRTAVLTRVGADHMGRFIREELAREGVDVSSVVSDPLRLTALVILGVRDRERFPLIFYRENCADMALVPEDVDEAQVAGAAAVLVNGTHLAQAGTAAACRRVIDVARAHGRRVVFDIDYRPVLWGLAARDMGEDRFVADATVTARLQEILPLCDLVVGTEEEFHILGGDLGTDTALAEVRARTDALLVLKQGADGCTAFPGAPVAEAGVRGCSFKVEVCNILGAGDAFMGGFLRGWLRDAPLARCCELGNAAGALVVARHACAPATPSWREMELFLDGPRPARVDDDREIADAHWADTRRGDYPELKVLAIDHRFQLEELAAACGADPARLHRLKSLALEAVDCTARGAPGFGVLLDGRLGGEALARAADLPYWVGRPIERPRSRPLEFESSADVATEIGAWPRRQVVKVLVFHHPDDPEDLRGRQMRQLQRLFDACRKTGHELLVEVILPADRKADADSRTVARALEQVYAAGVRPDWWKLEPAADPRAWREVEAVIAAHDPDCRGVVLLGLSQPEEALLAAFGAAAGSPMVKGFAVGRTVFQEPARAWLSGEIDDEGAVAELSRRFGRLVDGWARASAGRRGRAA